MKTPPEWPEELQKGVGECDERRRRVCFVLEVEQHARLQRRAKEQGRPTSHLLADLVREFLERDDLLPAP